MRAIAAVALGLAAIAAGAETLIMTSTGTMSIRDTATGEVRTCTANRMNLTGAFGSLRAVTLNGISIDATGCFQPIAPTSSSANVSFPLATPIASSKIPTTYVAVERLGVATGALSVTWRAKFPAGDQSGALTWPAGKGGRQFIALAIPLVSSSTSVPLSAGGANATLTVVP